jgi:pyruvate/2-oxoglutarate dehydrogenase complex dihydrolipoamide acyltransferase (E2) component
MIPAIHSLRDGSPGPLAPALLLAALAAACGPTETAPVREPARVAAVAVTTGPAQPPVLTSGVITTREEQRLSFKIGGIVRRIGVNEGEAVRAGQELAVLELTEVDAQLEQARQLADKARRDLVRSTRLRADEVISEEELEAIRTQAAVAQAALRAAEFNRNFSTIVAARSAACATAAWVRMASSSSSLMTSSARNRVLRARSRRALSASCRACSSCASTSVSSRIASSCPARTASPSLTPILRTMPPILKDSRSSSRVVITPLVRTGGCAGPLVTAAAATRAGSRTGAVSVGPQAAASAARSSTGARRPGLPSRGE